MDIIINGDCSLLLNDMADESVDMVLTSPPYDDLREYNGYNFNEYDFRQIARQLYRIVKTGGVVVWVVSDSTENGSETGTSWRQALYFKDRVGFNIHDTMIWLKKNPVPHNHNRYQQCFEYMFCFSKGKPKTFNPIMEPTLHKGETAEYGKRRAPKESVMHCRRSKKRVIGDSKLHTNAFAYSIGGNNGTSHPAVFPLQLALDQISTWTNENDVVLDPFSGSSTTGLACQRLKRKYIGIEISDVYVKEAENRLNTKDEKLSWK